MPAYTKDRPVDLILQAHRFVPEFRTSASIKRAHDLAVAAGGGYVVLEPGVTYTWNTAVVWEASIVGLIGNNAILDNSSQSGSAVYSLTLTSTKGDYPSVMEFRDFSFIGNSTTARDSLQTAIRCHTVTANSDVRVMLRNVRIQYQNTCLSIGSGAFLARGIGCEFARSKFGIQQESGATNFAENCVFTQSTLFNNDCHVKLNAGQRIKFFGCSFDYHGTQDGTRITSDDRAFYLSSGAHVSLYNCHIESNYGFYATQTNEWIYLNSTGDIFVMEGGVFYYAGTGNAPYLGAWLKSNAVFQRSRFVRVGFRGVGRVASAATHDDCFAIGSETTHTTGNGGSVSLEDCFSVNNAFTDLPAVVGYRPTMSWTRNGVDDPYLELSYKVTTTGTIALSNVTSDSPVNPRNSAGKMIKLTGAGVLKIAVPAPLGQKLYPWALFMNRSQATGTITVKENYTTYALKADGTLSADTRGANTSTNTKSLTGGGTNQWDRVSWKDVRGDTTVSARIGGGYSAFFVIEIDTSSMSGGSLYIDDFAYMPG
jgi:hypothetical protein